MHEDIEEEYIITDSVIGPYRIITGFEEKHEFVRQYLIYRFKKTVVYKLMGDRYMFRKEFRHTRFNEAMHFHTKLCRRIAYIVIPKSHISCLGSL